MLGFIRVAAATPVVDVANLSRNLDEIVACIQRADENGVDILTFPELCITGYTCGDLFLQDLLLSGAEQSVSSLLDLSASMDMVIAVGVPIYTDSALYNMCLLLHQGKILGAVPKEYLPNYGEFYERRWFSPGNSLLSSELTYAGQTFPVGGKLLFSCPERDNLTIGIEICEDMWVFDPPSVTHAQAGANVLLNLSASNELVSKADYRELLLSAHSGRLLSAYVYAAAGMGESTTDLVFGGHSLILENGAVLAESERFTLENQLIFEDIDLEKLENLRRQNKDATVNRPVEEIQKDYRIVPVPLGTYRGQNFTRKLEKRPFVPSSPETLAKNCAEIFAIQRAGLAKRLAHTRVKTAVLGISGGLDSTLALLAAVEAADFLGWDRSAVIGITMPGFGTTDRTYQNALNLMKALGITLREIPIKDAVLQHFTDIGHDPSVHDATYENAQARERTQILMDIANQTGGLVVGTGDLSELALGFATYNGDHMSMYGVNAGIPKTLVRALVTWVANRGHLGDTASSILHDIVDTPVSPELLPPGASGEIQQKTEEVVGPYALTDFFLYYFLRFGFSPKKILFLAETAFQDEYGRAEILHWMKSFFRRFFSQQFKRSCMPDGPKVGSVSLSPRGDWRMPSDASSALWLDALDKLEKN